MKQFSKETPKIALAAYLLAKTGVLNNVWWAFPIAEVMSVTVAAVFFIHLYKTVIKKLPENGEDI